MFCATCGAEILSDAQFCIQCGWQLPAALSSPSPRTASTPFSTPTSSSGGQSTMRPSLRTGADDVVDLTSPQASKRPRLSPSTLDSHGVVTVRVKDGSIIKKRPASALHPCEFQREGFPCSLKTSGCQTKQAIGRHHSWHREQGHVLSMRTKKAKTSLFEPVQRQLAITSAFSTFKLL